LPVRSRCIAAVLAALFAAACDDSGLKTPPTGPEDGDPGIVEDAGAPTESDAALAPQQVSVVVKPNGRADGEVIDAIKSATRTLRLYVYLLTDADVTAALVAKARAGVDVRVVLNKTFPVAGQDNQAVYDELVRGRVKVAWAPAGFVYSHAKVVVVDDRLAWIMTMNLTVSGSETNREYLVEDREAADVAEATAIFDADYGNRSYFPTGSLIVSPNNSTQRLVALVERATARVDLEGESLSDTDVVNALVAAKRRGATVRVVLANDRSPTTAQRSAVLALKSAQVPVVAFGNESGGGTRTVPYVHAKMILVDGREAYVGSANFTTNALDSNRELGLIVRDPASVASIGSTFEADFRGGRNL
jgi:cardiolipin synthase